MNKLNLYKPLYIDLIGEEADDYGGVTREYFSEIFEVCINKLFHGSSSKNLTPLHDLTRLEKNEFEIFGKLLSLALSHSCPGPRTGD